MTRDRRYEEIYILVIYKNTTTTPKDAARKAGNG